MYKAIFFDLDGTLLDTCGDIHKVINASLAHFNLPQITKTQTLQYVGNGAKLLVQRAVPGDKQELVEEVYKHFAYHFANCDNALTCLYEGEDEVLRTLNLHNVLLFLVTNKPQNAANKVYESHLKKYNFKEVIGQSDKFSLKPDPSAVNYLIDKYNLNKSDCLFVGDGETDVQTAINAGIDGVAVLWGFRTKAQLESQGAKLFVQDYKQLESIILNKAE